MYQEDPKEGNGKDGEDLEQPIAAVVEAHNNAPRADLGNLSPQQVKRLLTAEWGEADSPVQFNTDIALSELETSEFFCRSRKLLHKLRESGEIKATSGKNLPRSFVAEIMPHMVDEEMRETIQEYNKTINEEDVWPLHVARVVARCAGMIKLYKGKFSVPKTKLKLLDDDRAGELFRVLFVAYFRRFNVAYSRPIGPDVSSIQHSAAYALYRLGVVAQSWCAVADLAEEVLLPSVREEMAEELQNFPYFTMEELLVYRLLSPLIDWGVLEGWWESRYEKINIPYLKEIRTTPLFHKFIQMHV